MGPSTETSSGAAAGAGSPAEVAVRPALPEDASAVDAFVLSSEAGTFFHLTGWTRAVVEE